MLFNPFGFKYQGSITGQVASPPTVTVAALGTLDLFAGDVGTFVVNPYGAPATIGMPGYAMPQVAIGDNTQRELSTFGVFQSFSYVDNQTNQLIRGVKAYPKDRAAIATLYAEMIIDPGAIYSVQLDTADVVLPRPIPGEYGLLSTRTQTVGINVASYDGTTTIQYQHIPGSFTDADPSNQGIQRLTIDGSPIENYLNQMCYAQAYILGITAGIEGNNWGAINPIVDVILTNYGYAALAQAPVPAA